MLRRMTCVLMCAAGAVGAEPVTYAFDWQGNGGYGLRGALEYNSEEILGPFVTATDLTCFVIEGHQNEDPLGRWALLMLNEETTWRLHFDPATSSFLVEGDGVWMPQAWNMNGEGIDCGADGFGFNIGNAAQDICVNDTLIVESQVLPQTSFPATRVDRFGFPADACKTPAFLSMLWP